jgi:hypothetical protein
MHVHRQNLRAHLNNLHLPVMLAMALVEGNIPIRHLRSPLGFFDCRNKKTFLLLSLHLIPLPSILLFQLRLYLVQWYHFPKLKKD